MFKNLSVHFDSKTSERLSKDPGFQRSEGFRTAFAHPFSLLSANLAPSHQRLTDDQAKKMGGVYWKYFGRGHAEAHWIEDAYEKAHRVGIVISYDKGSRDFDPPWDYVKVHMHFFETGAHEPFYSYDASFDKETGE